MVCRADEILYEPFLHCKSMAKKVGCSRAKYLQELKVASFLETVAGGAAGALCPLVSTGPGMGEHVSPRTGRDLTAKKTEYYVSPTGKSRFLNWVSRCE